MQKIINKTLRIPAILFLDFISILPLRVRIFIARAGAYIVTPFLKRENFFIKLQSKVFLGKEVSPYKVYANIAQTFFEAFNLKSIKDENISVHMSQSDILDKIKHDQKPTIVLTAHTGNWELLAAYFIKKGLKIATAARMARYEIVQELIDRMRKNYGIKTIWRGGSQGAKDILNEVTSKHIMAGLIDQHTRVTSIPSTFFGHEVKVPYSLIKIAIKHDANIVIAFNFRRDLTHYDFYLHLLDSKIGEQEIVKTYNELLENYIRKYETQWVWMHKRWRVLDGKELSRKEYEKHLYDLLNNKFNNNNKE